VTPDDEAAGRKVGAGNRLQHRAQPRLLRLPALVDHGNDTVDHLAHVMRGNVRRHADRDPCGSVDQQVGERRRKNGRLFGRLVVIRHEVDGLFVEIRHHRFGERLRPRLGIPHGRGRIAIHGAEVSLAVDQGVAHVEFLREAYQRVVDRRVAVRVVVAHHLADDLGALAIRAIRREPHRAHAVQHAAMRRFQPVAHVRQRPPDDYAHGVIHVRALHLVFDVDRDSVLRGR
jgi:hypothetical protein